MKKYVITLLFFILLRVPAAYCINTPVEYMHMIKNYIELEQDQTALNKADEFVSAYPASEYSYATRAIVYIYCNDYYKAIADYDKAIQYSEVSQHTVSYYISKGKCYAALNKFVEALAQYNLIPLNFVDEMSHENRFEYYKLKATNEFLLKLYGVAIKDFTKAIELEPSPELYYLRANSYLHYNQDLENYRKDLSTAASLCQYQQTNECKAINDTYRFHFQTKMWMEELY